MVTVNLKMNAQDNDMVEISQVGARGAFILYAVVHVDMLMDSYHMRKELERGEQVTVKLVPVEG